jgi:hypothetical protein
MEAERQKIHELSVQTRADVAAHEAHRVA